MRGRLVHDQYTYLYYCTLRPYFYEHNPRYQAGKYVVPKRWKAPPGATPPNCRTTTAATAVQRGERRDGRQDTCQQHPEHAYSDTPLKTSSCPSCSHFGRASRTAILRHPLQYLIAPATFSDRIRPAVPWAALAPSPLQYV